MIKNWRERIAQAAAENAALIAEKYPNGILSIKPKDGTVWLLTDSLVTGLEPKFNYYTKSGRSICLNPAKSNAPKKEKYNENSKC